MAFSFLQFDAGPPQSAEKTCSSVIGAVKMPATASALKLQEPSQNINHTNTAVGQNIFCTDVFAVDQVSTTSQFLESVSF